MHKSHYTHPLHGVANLTQHLLRRECGVSVTLPIKSLDEEVLKQYTAVKQVAGPVTGLGVGKQDHLSTSRCKTKGCVKLSSGQGNGISCAKHKSIQETA